MEGQTIFFLVCAAIVSLFILYFIIRKAITDGMQPIFESIEGLLTLKKEELKLNGFDSHSLLSTIEKERALRKLDAKLRSGMLTMDSYQQKKTEILSGNI